MTSLLQLLQLAAFLSLGNFAFGAELGDWSKLPPPAAQQIDFARDIAPILQRSCYRCHGPERPKSGFRLDTQAQALRGGDKGVDILPGNSRQSPLIQFVAGLVPEREMPPPGKAPALTREEIALLRAWIDQGASYGEPIHYPIVQFSVSPGLRYVTIHGSRQKFRELNGEKEGWADGLAQFDLAETISPETSFTARGHIFPHDFDLHLALESPDLGFFHFGFKQFRRYDDDRGPFYEHYSPNQFRLGRDLPLDVGRAWFEAGLTLPHLPKVIFGYEFQFRDGSKSTLEWGPILGKNYFPAAKVIDEQTHILRLDLSYDFQDWHFEDAARVEFYDLKTYRSNVGAYSFGPLPDLLVNSRESAGHVLGLNTFHAERELTDWWFVSGGYYYAKLDGEAGFNQITTDGANNLAAGSFWYTDEILLSRESHIASLGTLLRPLDTLNFSAGLQAEWEGQHGIGRVHLDEGDPTQPLLYVLEPTFLESNLNRKRLAESLGLRFTGIKHAVLFAEARLAQEKIDQFEDEIGGFGQSFLRDTDYHNDRSELRLGGTFSPWNRFTLETSLKQKNSNSDYDHLPLYSPGAPQGYPTFILNREIRDQSLHARLGFTPAKWLRTFFTFEAGKADFSTTTEPASNTPRPRQTLAGGKVLAGAYEDRRYALNLSLTPHPRFSFNGTASYATFRLHTENNNHPSLLPYGNQILTISGSAAYVLDSKTDLAAGYDFSKSDFDARHVVDSVPLELPYRRHEFFLSLTRELNRKTKIFLRYNLDYFLEPQAENGYTAHGIFAMLTYRWN